MLLLLGEEGSAFQGRPDEMHPNTRVGMERHVRAVGRAVAEGKARNR